MFNDLINKATEISEEFVNSDLYKEYLVLLEKIKKDYSLLEKIGNYKRAQINFQGQVLANEVPSFEEEKKLSALYTELVMNEDCRNFLKVEAELLKNLNQIYEALGDKIDMLTTFK